MKRRGLGRDLSALLGSARSDEVEEGDELRQLAVASLQPGRHQMRRHFDSEALDTLAASIKAQGVVQPIVVRPAGDGRFEIVAGERRWRAAQQAGLATVPAVVRALDERTTMAVALVENIQRADLNPLEEAEALRRLIEECGLTHEQCAEAVGLSRAAVTNLLRLFELEPEVQERVREGQITLGHAKVLLAVDGQRQLALARQVVARRLSVRALESLLQLQPGKPKKPLPSPMAKLEGELGQRFGSRVRIRQTASGRGKLVIGFKDLGELERILKLMES